MTKSLLTTRLPSFSGKDRDKDEPEMQKSRYLWDPYSGVGGGRGPKKGKKREIQRTLSVWSPLILGFPICKKDLNLLKFYYIAFLNHAWKLLITFVIIFFFTEFYWYARYCLQIDNYRQEAVKVQSYSAGEIYWQTSSIRKMGNYSMRIGW